MKKESLLEALENLNLSPEEAAVFLAALELGGGYASTIAQKAKLPRVNCYHHLEKLQKRRLLSVAHRGRARFYTPEPPQVLVNEQAEKLKKARELLPELLSLTNLHPFKPRIQTFEGLEGIQKIFTQTEQAEKEILGYTDLKSLGERLPDYLPDYLKRITQKGIHQRLISPHTSEAKTFSQRFCPESARHTEILFVNPDRFPIENHLLLYNQTLAIISLNPAEPIGVLIESHALARTQRTLFNLAWLGATSFVAQN